MKSLSIRALFLVAVLASAQAEPVPEAAATRPKGKSLVQTHLQVGLISMSAVPWQLEDNFQRMEAYVREAAKRRAQLIVAPEGALDGYPAGADPDVTKEAMRAVAQTVPDGPYLKRAAALCRELGVYLIFGFLEKSGNDLFNSCALFDPHGQILAKYRKIRPSGESFITPGQELKTFETPFGRIGLLICMDRGIPANFAVLAAQRAQIIIVPMNGSGGPENTVVMAQRAKDNDCAIIVANSNSSVIVNCFGETTLMKYETEAVSVGQIYYAYDIDQKGENRGNFLGRRPDLYGPLTQPPPVGSAFDAKGAPTPEEEKARVEAREKLKQLYRDNPTAPGS